MMIGKRRLVVVLSFKNESGFGTLIYTKMIDRGVTCQFYYTVEPVSPEKI